MSGQRCPSCGGYEWSNGVCKVCGYVPNISTPRFELEKLDLNKFHALAIKQVTEKITRAIPQLSDCSHCQEHSLFFASIPYHSVDAQIGGT